MAKTSITAKLGLDTTAFQRGLAKSQKSIKNFAKSATATFVRIGATFAGVGLIKNIMGLGLAAGETASKFEAVFGPAADSMNEKVQELRKTIPATTAEMQNALSTFAAMAKGFGLNTEAANIFSVEMVKVAGDIASFHDLPIEEAFGKIRSAVSGEFEPMKALGIVINEARLKQEGLNLAIWDGTGQMSAAQKALAVQSIMIRDLGDANGDAAITANSAANQVKFLTKQLKEQGTEIGTTMLPGIVALTKAFGVLVNLADEAMTGVGTALGELVFGDVGTSEQEQAKEDLAKRGITQKSVNHARTYRKLVDEQVMLNKKKAKEEKDAAEEAIKNTESLTDELEDQIKVETDPARKKALEERLKAYKDLIAAAGKLKSQEAIKPGSREAKAAAAAGISLTGGSSATGERRRKFGESLTRYDPTTGEERKLGESFSRSDSVNRQQRLKDVMANLAAKNASGQNKESAESATIKSAEHLEVIKDELTRKGN